MFELGERLAVKVCRVDAFKKQVDFEPAQAEAASEGKKKPTREERRPGKRTSPSRRPKSQEKVSKQAAKAGKDARSPKRRKR
ncbi:MAG: hypothetical protein EBS01_13475 [Verrucomicrobia bacterium]|nr:hypothetical protein [Verrucomicrobiota bacterium]